MILPYETSFVAFLPTASNMSRPFHSSDSFHDIRQTQGSGVPVAGRGSGVSSSHRLGAIGYRTRTWPSDQLPVEPGFHDFAQLPGEKDQRWDAGTSVEIGATPITLVAEPPTGGIRGSGSTCLNHQRQEPNRHQLQVPPASAVSLLSWSPVLTLPRTT